MKLVSREIWIDAPAALVFELLTEATHLVEWMAVEAHADAVPGGLLSWRQVSGDVVEGRFIEVVPDRATAKPGDRFKVDGSFSVEHTGTGTGDFARMFFDVQVRQRSQSLTCGGLRPDGCRRSAHRADQT